MAVGDFLVTTAQGGGIAYVSEVLPKRPSLPQVEKNRGKVQGFSRSSKLRMNEAFLRIDRNQVKGVIFDTLSCRRGVLG